MHPYSLLMVLTKVVIVIPLMSWFCVILHSSLSSDWLVTVMGRCDYSAAVSVTSVRSPSVTASWGSAPSVQTWSTIKGCARYLRDPLPAHKHPLHGNASVPLLSTHARHAANLVFASVSRTNLSMLHSVQEPYVFVLLPDDEASENFLTRCAIVWILSLQWGLTSSLILLSPSAGFGC